MIIGKRAPLMALLGLCIVALSAPPAHAQTADETARAKRSDHGSAHVRAENHSRLLQLKQDREN